MGGIDVIWMTPSFAEYLIERSQELIGMDVKDLGIRNIISGAEPGAGIPEVRSRIESAYGARLYDCMGLTSIMFASCDHDTYQGMHFVSEDTCLLELVDPETRETIPLEEGATGVGVLTPLAGESLTVVRHFTGDVMQVSTEPCPCGNTGMRIKVVGRTDDMLKVKGVMVYPAAIDEIITGFVPQVTGEFRIVLHEPPPRVEPPLHLKVESGGDTPQEALEALTKQIQEKMHSKIRVRPRIEWIPPNSLERSTHKTQFIEKAYEKKA
jgi:phenylacetate-CoA ligase